MTFSISFTRLLCAQYSSCYSYKNHPLFLFLTLLFSVFFVRFDCLRVFLEMEKGQYNQFLVRTSGTSGGESSASVASTTGYSRTY